MLTKKHNGKKIVYGFSYEYKDSSGKRKQIFRRNVKWTRSDAENAEREFVNSLNYDKSAGVVTYYDLYQEYMKQKERDLMKLRSQYDLNKVFSKHILPCFGDMYVTKIEPRHIEKWQDTLIQSTYLAGNKDNKHSEKYSNRQLEKIQTNLNATFEFAIDKRIIQFNPFRFVGLRKRRIEPQKEKLSIITPKEFSLIYNAIQSSGDELTRLQDSVIFTVLYWCGLRKGELMALDIKDYDYFHKELNIYKNWDYVTKNITSPKTENGTRNVSVPDIVDDCIMQLISYYRKMPGFSIDLPLVSYSKRLAPTTLTRKKDSYFSKAGLPRITLHDFRHSHVSYLINSDDNFRDFDVAKRIGDTVQEINETYGHLFREKQKSMVKNMNRFQMNNQN